MKTPLLYSFAAISAYFCLSRLFLSWLNEESAILTIPASSRLNSFRINGSSMVCVFAVASCWASEIIVRLKSEDIENLPQFNNNVHSFWHNYILLLRMTRYMRVRSLTHVPPVK